MKINEFAESVLYGTSMDSKLLAMDSLVDGDHPALTTIPELPGRPQALRFLLEGESRRGGAEFPTRGEMEADVGRGRIMHFFANHELLALELMALMLLKFPDPGAAWRRILIRTMKDEQRHLSLYLARMEALGVGFGDVKVGRFFWDALREARSPLEFLAGMSLTFEQANLDFSLMYMRDMEEIGDEESRQILEEVYRDEIGHVAHGWDLFEQLRPKVGTAFHEYAELLNGRLTPRHARGRTFSREARLKAGLSPEFIDEVEVFASSRGRVPFLFYFNPSCEEELLGKTPGTVLNQLQRDLEILPSYLAKEDDLVLVSEKPRTEFKKRLRDVGIPSPGFVTVDDLASRQWPLREFKPWGHSQAARSIVSDVERLFQVEAPGLERGSDVHRKSFARGQALAVLEALPDAWRSFVCPQDVLPRVAKTEDEVLSLCDRLCAEGKKNIVIKADLGASGRNMIRLLDEEIAAKELEWVRHALKDHGALCVEPWLDRCADLSIHFDVVDHGATQPQLVTFANDRRGQFKQAVVSQALPALPQEVSRALHEAGLRAAFDGGVKIIAATVSAALSEQGYTGPVGIDTFFYRDEEGAVRWRPLVEINPRWTMGRVALCLRSRVSRGAFALFEIERFKSNASLEETLLKREREASIETKDGRLSAGYVCLTEVRKASQFAAGLWAGTAARERFTSQKL